MEENFKKINVNDEAEIFHTVSQSDLDCFVQLTGDNNPLHIDNEYASKTIFKKCIAHGMLSASFISTLIGTKLPGKGALWYEQHTRFVLPVYVGDTIRVWAKVKQKSTAMRLLILEVAIFNEDNVKVIECEAKVRVLKTEK